MKVTYPGVYITEVESNVRPIDGVSTSTTNVLGSAQLAHIKELANSVAPDWTGSDDGDPGVALLELFAWLAESLLYRVNQVPDAAAVHAARLAAVALQLVSHREPPKVSLIKTARFYDHGVLVADEPAGERRDNDLCVWIRRP
jgi:phage tail sheath protein FI